MRDVCEGLTNFVRSSRACRIIILLEVAGQRPGAGWEPSPPHLGKRQKNPREVASEASPASIAFSLCRKIFGQHAKSMSYINFAKQNWFLFDRGQKAFADGLYLRCGTFSISSIVCVQLQNVEIQLIKLV